MRGGRCGNPSLLYSETRRPSVCHQPPHVFKLHAVQARVTDSHWEAVSTSSHKHVGSATVSCEPDTTGTKNIALP